MAALITTDRKFSYNNINDTAINFFVFPSVTVLSTSKIAKDVMNKVLEVCKQWNEGTPSFCKSKMKYESCVHAIKNTRRKMEDKHVILPQFNNLFGFQEVLLPFIN